MSTSRSTIRLIWLEWQHHLNDPMNVPFYISAPISDSKRHVEQSIEQFATQWLIRTLNVRLTKLHRRKKKSDVQHDDEESVGSHD